MESHLPALLDILIFTLAGVGFIITTLLVSRLIGPKRPGPVKNSTYESGEAALGRSWPQTGSGYMVFALLFLLFEVEIVLLFPLAVVFGSTTDDGLRMFVWLEIIAFVFLLAVALAYAWANGHLDWMKPSAGRQQQYRSPVPPERYDEFNRKYS
ncbi:MAG: NADH-quinone oxidoreductase subunit A [Bacteroidota bacterium]